MLNIPEYKEYGGETRIALMDNSSLAFMHELSQRSYPADRILGVYDLILIPKWVMEEIEDSTYRSTYVYRKGMIDAQFSYSTAVGMFNCLVSFALVMITNKISQKVNGSGLW